MKEINVFTKNNANEFERYVDDLAKAYKVAFAGTPWYEVSKCGDDACQINFSRKEPGTECEVCNTTLDEAYDEEALIKHWTALLENEQAFVEVATNNGAAYLATIARPTTPDELMIRKYDDVPAMGDWIHTMLADDFVWIEDSFANKNIVRQGNLINRGATLGRIATNYSGLTIVTRTLNPAIIAATARDTGKSSRLYPGSSPTYYDGRYDISVEDAVPDTRSVLKVNGNELI